MKINTEIYTGVEKVLDKYPISWKKNYDQNKESLMVIQENKKIGNALASYQHEKNIITVFDTTQKALPHELFHMAFRDPKKVGKKVGEKAIYKNGVSFESIQDQKIHLKGVNEGLAEYLSRFCNPCQGHEIEYFFVDLLISIYGEEILEYPLKNDPVGFLGDDRFFDIFTLSSNLDFYFEVITEMELTVYLRKHLDCIVEKSEAARKEVVEAMEHNTKLLYQSLVDTFSSITLEYLSCQNPKIKKSLFIKKLSSLLTDSEYRILLKNESTYGFMKQIQKRIEYVEKH